MISSPASGPTQARASTSPQPGWIVDFLSISPAGSLDWRGYATVHAVDILRRNGRA
jgi:hypothetical protein